MSRSLVQQRQQFRAKEVGQLLKWARGGDSASIIGVSGVGKSNLFNHLLDPNVQQTHLEDKADNYLFVRVNFHYIPDFTNRSLYSVIMEQFELLDPQREALGITHDDVDQLSQYHELLLEAGEDVLKVQRYFKLAIRLLLRQSNRQIIFVFDQFDDVYQNANDRFFANLRGLRETYKYRVSYFAFTRSLLTNLADMDPAREEFSELLSTNVVGLGPYNEADARSLLERVSSRLHLPLSEALIKRLLRLSGGHAGLLKSSYLAVVQGGLELPEDDPAAVKKLLLLVDVESECSKIWSSIRVDEEKLIARLAHTGGASADDYQIIRELQIKGLLTEGESPEVFCPLFAEYVRQQEALWERPLYLDPQSRQIWVLGQPTEPLTALEYKLFRVLYARLGEIVDKDELIDAGWPEAKGGVSDQAITAAMYRLRRKIEPDSNNPRFLESFRGQGYQLQSGEPNKK